MSATGDPNARQPTNYAQAEGHRLAFELANWVPKADREQLPIYTAVGRLAAESPELLATYDAVEPSRRHPGLLFGAVHYLLLEGADHPLADHLASVRWYRGREDAAPLGDPVEAFCDFLKAFSGPVQATMATHEVQTNEVGRLAYLSPAIAVAQAELGDAAVLVDLGCSAGLNLAPHLATTTYVEANGDERLVGNPANRLQLRSKLHGSGSPAAAAAPQHALGIDLRPVDLRQGDAARWLLALTWAEDLPRFQRTASAIEALIEQPIPPQLVAASMTEVEGVVGPRFGDAPVVVVNSWSAAYLNEAEQQQLSASIAELASTRPVRWVVAEHPKAVPGLPIDHSALPTNGSTGVYLLNPAEPAKARRLAEAHPHGRWVHWGDLGAS